MLLRRKERAADYRDVSRPPRAVSNDQALPPELDRIAYNKSREFSASFLGLSINGLETLHKQGRGPKCKKIGRLRRYCLADLIAWTEAQPSVGGQRPAA